VRAVSRLELGAATALRRGIAGARRATPPGVRRSPVGRALRTLASRMGTAAASLQGNAIDRTWAESTRLNTEARIAQANGQFDVAVDRLLSMAELGVEVDVTTHLLHTLPGLTEVGRQPAVRRRMRDLIARNPHSPEIRMLVGVFLLDQGLAEGGDHVAAGYRMTAERRWPDLVEAMSPEQPRRTPAFMVLGPPKAATTTIYELLVQHPQVLPSPRKELAFWSHRYGRAPELYDLYFPPLSQASNRVTCDVSPAYISSPEAAQAVGERFPRMRAIVMHRDPVARAYSHFQMNQRLYRESRTFEEVVASDLELLGETAPLDASDVREAAVPYAYRYLLSGCLLPRLQLWTRALGPERVLVVDVERFRRDPAATMNQVFDFVGLPPAPIAHLEPRNVSTYSTMKPETEDRLRQWFAPHEEALRAFIAERRLSAVAASS
jgi:hypothetical protein